MSTGSRYGRGARTVAVVLSVLLAAGGPAAAAATSVAPAPGASLAVSTDPGGATVYVDGRVHGVTPVQVALAPGEHRVRVTKAGYLENSRLVSVQAGQPRPLSITLTPAPQVEEKPEKPSGGGSGKKVALIVLGAAAVGAGVYFATKKSDKPPVAGTVSVSPATALAGATSVTFTAQGANDPDGDPLTFSWNFGDSGTGSGQTTSHVYNTGGTFNVQVTVTAKAKSATASGSVTVRTLAGAWGGTATAAGFSAPFSMNLTQNGSAVTGTYSDADGPGSVSGSVSAPLAVRLTVNQPPFAPFTFTGTADSGINSISGSVLGLAFTMTRR